MVTTVYRINKQNLESKHINIHKHLNRRSFVIIIFVFVRIMN
jgi:hypothetical protein